MARTMRFIGLGFLFPFILLTCLGLAEESKAWKRQFSLRITGGAEELAVGDMNIHLQSVNEAYSPPEGNGTVYSPARVQLLNKLVASWEIELRLEIVRRFGVGFSVANPVHLSKPSHILLYPSFSNSTASVGFFDCSPEIKNRFPVKVSAFYALPIIKRTEVVFKAGAGLYSARMRNAINSEVTFEGLGTGFYRNEWETDWKSTVGFHGGVGAEYSWSSRLALVFDVEYRYVKTSGFQATMHTDPAVIPYPGFFYDERGTLFRYVWGEIGVVDSFFKEFYVWSGTPPSYTLERGGPDGKALLDLGGFTVQLGVRINLF